VFVLLLGCSGATRAHAADVQATIDYSGDGTLFSGLVLDYKWNWGGLGLYHNANGWAPGLYNPYVQVNYHATITNLDSGQNVTANAVVPVGTHLRFSFTPHVYNDIYWFGTGASQDSPYGDWIANAAGPSLSCNAKDFVNTVYSYSDWASNEYNHGQPTTLDVFIPLSVNPPMEAITSTGGLSCGTLSSPADGGHMDCTVTKPGNYSPVFNFGQTYGKFYYRYKNYAHYPSDAKAPPVGSCLANNVPMRADPNAGTICVFNCPTPDSQPDFVMNVPAQQISIPFSTGTTDWPNLKADTPGDISNVIGQASTLGTTVRNAGAGSTNAPFPATLWVSSDMTTNGTAVKVWQGSSALGIPNGYPANYAESVSSAWTSSSVGTYYYRFCADEDASWNGAIPESNETDNCSGWGTISVHPNNPDLTAGAVTPTTATVNVPVMLTATATNIGAVPAGAFPMAFEIQGPATVVSPYISGLAAGASAPASASYTFKAVGTYLVAACANKNIAGTNIITESDYFNDCGPFTTITVGTTPQPVPTCSLSASPAATVPSTLTWSSTNATSCTGGGFSTGGATSGSKSVSTAGSYTLSCSGSGGSCSDSVSLGNTCTNPKATISAAPDRVKSGSTTKITYGATGVDGSCTITGPGAPSGGIPSNSCNVSNASFTTPALTTQTTYTITCGGTSTTVIVNVVPDFTEF